MVSEQIIELKRHENYYDCLQLAKKNEATLRKEYLNLIDKCDEASATILQLQEEQYQARTRRVELLDDLKNISKENEQYAVQVKQLE